MVAAEDRPMTGACLCGAVTFEVTPPSTACAHCHCSICRRNHGAAYVTWLVVNRSQVEVTEGAELLTRFESSPKGSRSFCSVCGSALFCEIKERPDEIDIPLANMTGPVDLEPQFHVFASDAVDWIDSADDLPHLGGESGMEPLDE